MRHFSPGSNSTPTPCWRANRALIAEAIATCCRHKAGIVARDETEHGERALLNFGHTFGACAGNRERLSARCCTARQSPSACCWRHAFRRSLRRAPSGDAQRLAALLERFGLPTAIPADIDVQRLLDLMRLDKKNLSGRLRLILWRGIGSAEIVPDVDEAAISEVLGDRGLRAEG